MQMVIDSVLKDIVKYLNQDVKAAPLAAFRIFFGFLMAISMIRFWYHGWIEKLYLEPKMHFHYLGFECIKVPGDFTYVLFIICTMSALFVAVGYKYRLAIIMFFLSFGYIELMDKTTYLNHYYFISVLSFMLIWLPMDRYFSFDARWNGKIASQYVKQWHIDILKVMLAIVYIYAGAAKLNADWMLKAMPLTIWLPTKFDIPLLGSIMHEKWLHYLFSWGGAFYDLLIVPLLIWSRTRIFAFIMVVVFHVLTRVLFPIGMFPYIMICSTLIFFSAEFHERLLASLSKILCISKSYFDNDTPFKTRLIDRVSPWILGVFIFVQLIFPLRFLLYTGNVFWTEQGYRFAWRVMLMEKTGYANFRIVDGVTGKEFYVQNEDFLTATQQKQMATQPDFILEYAHYLGDHFESQGHQNVEVYVESYASLNGRKSQVYVNPELDLLKIENNLKQRDYLVPLND